MLKVLKEAQVNLLDLQYQVKTHYGINFKTCHISGHNMHDLVERRIRTVEEALEKAGIKNMRMHVTGLQTLAKPMENEVNNLPIGYSYGKNDSNTPLLRILTPNLLRLGRLNSRSLYGPIKLPSGPGDMMKTRRLRATCPLYGRSVKSRLLRLASALLSAR